MVRIQDGRIGLWVKNGGTLLRNYAIPLDFRYAIVSGTVSLNDNRHVLWYFEDTLPLRGATTHIRYEDGDADPIIGVGSEFFTETPFDYVLPVATMNNSGRAVFSANLKSGGTVVASRPNDRDPHDMSPPLSGFPVFYPAISDNDRTIIRGGASLSAPIILFLDRTLNVGTAIGLAASPEFSQLGDRSGISDDGKIVVFQGSHSTDGVGIYVSAIGATSYTAPLRVAGRSHDGKLDLNETWIDSDHDGVLDMQEDLGYFSYFPFPNVEPQPGTHRVCVNRSAHPSGTVYTLAFMAYDRANINGAVGRLGLHVMQIDVANPLNPIVSVPTAVIKVGDSVSGLSGTIAEISIHDAVNNGGQLGFWVRMSSGQEIVIRATPVNKPVVVLVRGLHVLWEGWGVRNPKLSTDPHIYWRDAEAYLTANGFEVWVCDTITGTQYVWDEAAGLNRYINQKLTERRLRGLSDLVKLSVVAHSYGGLITRYYLHNYAHRVDKAVMLSGVNCGSRAADIGLGDSTVWPSLTRPVNAGSRRAMACMTSDFVQNTFNVRFDDRHPSVPFFLLGGEGGDDSTDPTLRRGWGELIHFPSGTVNPNDGAVTLCSALGWRWNGPPWVSELQVGRDSTWRWDATFNDHSEMTRNPTTLVVVREILLNRPLLGGIVGPPCAPLPAAALPAAPSTPERNRRTTLQGGTLTPGQSTAISTTVGSSTATEFILRSGPEFVQLQLTTPSGTPITTNSINASISYAFNPLEGGFWQSFSISNPEPGNWTIRLLNTGTNAGGADWSFIATEMSDIVATPISEHYQTVGNAALRIEVRRGATPFSSASVQATVIQPAGSQQTIALYDDGVHADGVAGDGIFAVLYNSATNAGLHLIQYTVSGTAGAPFTRSASESIQVAPLSALFNNSFSDRGVDVGPEPGFEKLAITVDLGITVDGRYSLSAVLADGLGQFIASASVGPVQLLAGTTSLTLEFDGDAIRQAERDGPYLLRNLCLWQETQDLPLRVAFRPDPYRTGGYHYADFASRPAPEISGLAVRREGPDTVRLSWTGSTNRLYAVEASADLRLWNELAVLFAESADMEYIANSIAVIHQFFRVRVSP